MRKNHVSALLSILLIFTFVLTACAPATQAPAPAQAEPTKAPEQQQAAPTTTTAPAAPEPTKAAEPAAAAGAVSPAGEFPIVKEPITLKILLVQTTGVSDYETNEFTKWLQDKTNIKLDFDVAPMSREEYRQKLNLVLASGQLPDIIMNFGLPLDEQQTLADQGLILPLDDLIAKYGVEFKKVEEAYPQTKTTFSLADGKMYSMPHINDCYHCSLSQKAWIYQPWLDKLGLKMPTTTDELEQVLLAFKDKDPNGNGKADEIPWSGAQTGSWHAELDSFIMNSFVINDNLGTVPHMYVQDGKIQMSYAQPGWKDGIIYLNKLFKEGLIDPEVFTNDMTKHKGLGENPDTAIMGFTQAGWPGMFIDWNAGASTRWKEYVPVAPLKGPTGIQQEPMSPYGFGSTGAAMITKDCKYVDAAYRLIDLMYSYESTMRSVYGRPGTEWEEAKAGAESITGEGSPRYNVLVAWAEQEQAITWQQAAPTFRSTQFRLEWQQFNPADPLERYLYQWSKNLYAPYGKPDMEVPPLIFSSEQAQKLGTLSTALKTYEEQMFAAFVTGQQDVNTGWDAYLEGLKTNGLDEFLSIYQTAYDKKMGK
jgi:putative aldouronate transport system substrate-binding protein